MTTYPVIYSSGQYEEPVWFEFVTAKSRKEAFELAERNDANHIVLTQKEARKLANELYKIFDMGLNANQKMWLKQQLKDEIKWADENKNLAHAVEMEDLRKKLL